MAEIRAEQGMVRTQAQIILPATPQRTALKRLIEPTPAIAPVMVCVVLTGMPIAVETNNVIAAPVSAQKPSTDLSLDIFCPIVLTIRHPPNIVPSEIAPWQAMTTQGGI